MTWANFGVLGIGGLLMAVPIILHFLMQPKPVEVDFPALRFLQRRQQSTRARVRIKHFLLLLMRCLVIGLVALALAGPSVASSQFGNWLSLGGVLLSAMVVGGIAALAYFRPQKSWPLIGALGAILAAHLIYGGYGLIQLLSSDDARLIGDDQAPVAALIVIDTSPRMQLQFENQTRLEKSQAFAHWLVGQFPADSQICIAATDGEPPFFSVDVGAANRRIEVLETSYVGPQLPSTIEEGLKILESAPQERKEIYVLSDLTAESWAGESTETLTRRLNRNEEISLFLIDVGVPDPSNFAVDQIQLSAAEIAPGNTLQVSTQLLRSGSADQRTVSLVLERQDTSRPVVRDGETLFPESTYPPQTMNVAVRENGSAPVQFTLSEPLELGTYHGTVEIEAADGLAIDDRRYFTFRVAAARNVLVVHGEDVFFRPVISLLAPEQLVRSGMAKYRVEVATQSELAQQQVDMSEFDAVFLVDPQPIDSATWQRLSEYVEIGRGLGIFLGHHAVTNGQIDPSFLTPEARRVLGGELDLIWFNETDDLFLSPDELSHPIFWALQGRETGVQWNAFPIYQHWGLQTETENPDFPTQVLLRYSNREPALVERKIGLGRVLTMTTPISEPSYLEDRLSWNRLLTDRPVPWFYLMSGISRYLVQSDAASLNVSVGETAVFENDLRNQPEAYRAFSPDPKRPPSRLNTVDGRIRYRFNNQPGHYRFRGILDDEVVLKGFSANLDPAATNLQRVRPDELDDILGADRYQLAAEQDEIQRQQGTMRRGQEFYPLLVVILVVLLAVELLMSNRFYS